LICVPDSATDNRTSLFSQFGLFIKLCLIASSFTFAVVLIFLRFFEVMQKIVEIRKWKIRT